MTEGETPSRDVDPATRRRGLIVIGLLVAAVLGPMWFVGIQGEAPAEEIAIDGSVSEIRPLAGFLDTPTKLSPSQVGVIVWIALFCLMGALTAAHRFMNEAVRPDDSDDRDRTDVARADGGTGTASETAADETGFGGSGRARDRTRSPWLEADSREVVEYHDAANTREGIVVMGALTVLAIVFAALFTGEYLTLARTQYFGVYAAGLFLSLAASTIAYYAWFMPHVVVAEERSH